MTPEELDRLGRLLADAGAPVTARKCYAEVDCARALHNAAPALIAAARALHTLQIGVGHPMWLPSVADALEMDEPFAATSGDVLERVRALAREVERLRAFVPVWRREDEHTLHLTLGPVALGGVMGPHPESGLWGAMATGDDGVTEHPDLPTAAAAICARLGIPGVGVGDV